MKVNTPVLGPIVGFTTPTQTRIWFRGQFEPKDGGYRRCFGVIQFKVKGVANWNKPIIDKLSPNFDMTGVFVLSGLQPDTDYEYQVGWFLADAEAGAAKSIGNFEWLSNKSWALRTSTTNAKAARSYIVGSCRYLLRLFGGALLDDRGDKVFRSVLQQINNKRRVDALLMIGDQIYADDLNWVSPDTRLDQFLERYRTVFGQEYIRELMSQVPTYMILDDHEIEDNWPQKATAVDRLTLFPNAIHAYQIYQCSHSPLFEADKQGGITGALSHFWYTFVDGCAEWFVTDCRTERVWDALPVNRRMMKDEQMKALLKWLNNGSGLVKMIVTSVPFIPDLNSESADKWSGYIPERDEILDFIFKNNIPKVNFVSGDVHCSFTVQLTVSGAPAFSVYQIISSSFFWPYPHMAETDFVFNKALTTNSANKYQVGKSSKVYGDDNFARLDITLQQITVSYFERKGDPLGKPVVLTL